DSIKNKTNPKLNKLFIELSTIELPPVMLKQNISKLNFVEKEDKKYINIFMAFNDYYSIAAAASINSIVKNSSKKNYYKLNLICDSILPKNIGAIKSILTNYPNFTLSLINAKDIYGLDLKFLKVRSYYHPSTYARLYIPTIYQNIDKCIYIDVDTIITVDIATLYNIDISDNYIAGVRDFGILAEENLYNKKLISKNIDKFNRAQYTKDTLGINNLENYFQASVLILNLKEIRKDKLELQLIQEIGKGQYLYQDQDILNKVLKSKVHYLDYNWSAPCSNIKDYNTFYAALNFSDYKKYIKSFENIKIAHYLGKTKPWNFPDTIERELYLTYIKDTLLNIDDFKSNPSLAKPVKKNNATNI
ncbi:MAG: glycosyltransferase family 8 protein, partial [Psittacicella sp.]